MPIPTSQPRTLYDKVFDDHVVHQGEGDVLIYIDRHLVHEVTSPQAFEGLRNASRPVRRPDCTLVTVDHNIPTSVRDPKKSMYSQVHEPDSRAQLSALEENVKEFGLTYFGFGDRRQGIVHVIGPEQGFTLPGTTVVCGDSHTSTHGAFGALAFGIGTSEVEHVLATQTLMQNKSKNMRVSVEGHLPAGVTSKDIVLHIIGLIGTAGGTGTVIEFTGSAIRELSMEARMSICNMSIEGGARAGMIAPDEITFEYLRGRPLAPKAGDEWDTAEAYWRTLVADPGAKYDIEVDIRAEDIIPTVTWGTSPEDVVAINGSVPDPAQVADPIKRAGMERSLFYMGLEPNVPISSVTIDKAFLGSCTNSRIEDLRAAAAVILSLPVGSTVAPGIYAMVVPGSGLIKEQAEAEGLDVVFKAAGWDWREAGCSMCLGMNPDQLKPQERCASTSNRNFEGRQGAGGRTHLMSPAMVAAAAMTGKLTDVREITAKNSPRAENVKITQSLSYLTDKVEAAPAPAAPLSKEAATEVTPIAAVNAPVSIASGMPSFTILKGIAAPLSIPNVDTDMLIPKQFLKTLKRTGLGSALFWSRRYLPGGEENPDFVLNQEPFRQSKILVSVGENFGCGSSREHAPWALNDFGIRCMIAPSFGDIFFNNSFKNGMLPIVLPQADCDTLYADARTGAEIEVDLHRNVVVRPNGETLAFEVEAFRRNCLLEGLDDIGITLKKADHISTFERSRTSTWPWLDGLGYAKIGQKNVVKGSSSSPKAKPTDW